MRHIKILILIFSLFTLAAYGQEDANEKFPKAGYVKNEKAVVKAGDNINFEDLCSLSKFDSVKIIDRRYSWFKILLPKKAFLYINKDYVDLTSDEKGVGIINASNVNLRAGAGTRYSIVGQISRPEKVSIISEDNGWYKIAPPYGAAGWIHSDQITLTEGKETKISEQKKAEPEQKKIADPIVRIGADRPAPTKGNLSIH